MEASIIVGAPSPLPLKMENPKRSVDLPQSKTYSALQDELGHCKYSIQNKNMILSARPLQSLLENFLKAL